MAESEPNWIYEMLDETEARAAAASARVLEANLERVRRQERHYHEQREDRLVSSLAGPGLGRALDIAGERLTKRRMEDLTVAIGPVLAAQVQRSVSDAINRTKHRARFGEGIYSERGVVNYVTITLPEVAYRIYQDGLTGVWSI